MPLKPCRTCGKEVAQDAKTCPHCGASDPAPGALSLGITVGCMGALILVFLVIAFNTGSERGGRSNLIEAAAACENRIKDRYRLSSEARFPYRNPEGIVATTDSVTYTVVSEAEIPNAFGALVRRRYICTLEKVGGGWEWRGGGLEGARE